MDIVKYNTQMALYLCWRCSSCRLFVTGGHDARYKDAQERYLAKHIGLRSEKSN